MGEYLDTSGVQELWSAAKNTLVNDIGVVSSTSGQQRVSGNTGSVADDQTQGGIGATYYATGTTNIGVGCNNVTISSGSCTYNTSTGEVSWKIPGIRANQSVNAILTWEGGTALTTVKDGVVEKVAHFNTINGQSIVNTNGTVNIEVGGSISLYRHHITLYIVSSEEGWSQYRSVEFDIFNSNSTAYTTEAQIASVLSDYGRVCCSATNGGVDYTEPKIVHSDGYDIFIDVASSDTEAVTARVYDTVTQIL